MKIVHIGRVDGDLSNGVHVTTGVAVLALQKRKDISVEVWRFSRRVRIITHSEWRGIKITVLPAIGPTGRFGSWLQVPSLGAIRWLKREAPRVTAFHLHSVFQPDHLWIRKSKRPYILTPHGGYGPALRNGRQSPLKRLWLSILERPLLRGASAVHALTLREAGNILAIEPRSAIRVAVFPLAASSVLHAAPGTNRHSQSKFLYVGRLDVEVKGLDLLLEGWSLCGARASGAVLTIAGPAVGPSGREISDIIQKKEISGSVRMMGPVFGPDKIAMLQDTDWFIQTSRHEGLPVAPLEALAQGTPVIFTPETNLDLDLDAEHRSCGIKASGEPRSIAQAIDLADSIRGSNYVSMSAAAIKHVESRFSEEATVRAFMSMYREASRS
jgi:glycosyltransferase involved in cell wall biosynthesis